MTANPATEGGFVGSRRVWLLRVAMLILGVLLGIPVVLMWNAARPASVVSTTPAGPNRPDAAPAALAPDFDIPLLGSDARFRLSDSRGQGVVINFWASWCDPCRKEAPFLEEGWRTYRDDGIIFVGVNVSDSAEAAGAFLREFGITYPNGQDTDRAVSSSYGLIGLPTTVFVTPDGQIGRTVVGGLTREKLLDAVQDIRPK